MNVTLKNGNKGILTVDTKAQKVVLETNGITYLIAFIREGKRVVVKNDMMLNESDMSFAKAELDKLIKKVDTSKKGRK